MSKQLIINGVVQFSYPDIVENVEAGLKTEYQNEVLVFIQKRAVEFWLKDVVTKYRPCKGVYRRILVDAGLSLIEIEYVLKAIKYEDNN